MIFPNEHISIYQTSQLSDFNSDTPTGLNRVVMMSMDQYPSIDAQHPQHHPQQSYHDIESTGLPVNPLEFPTPILHRACLRTSQALFDPLAAIPSRSSRTKGPPMQPSNLLEEVSLLCHIKAANHSYWIQNAVSSISRNIHLGIVVVRRTYTENDNDIGIAEWVTTNERVLIKCTSTVRSRNSPPLTADEACLQLIGNYHKNILGCIEVLQTDEYLYTIMPYSSGISTLESYLQQRTALPYNNTRPPMYNNNNNNNRLLRNSPKPTTTKKTQEIISSSEFTVRTVSSDSTIHTNDSTTTSTAGTILSNMFTVYENGHEYNSINSSTATTKTCPTILSSHESNVRLLFCNLLDALQHLQRKGVCHRNINPSTVLVVESHLSVASTNNAVLLFTDFTNAVRIPYQDESNVGGIADVSQGSHRLLIKNTYYRTTTRPTRSPSNDVNSAMIGGSSRSQRIRRSHSTTTASSTNRPQSTSKKVPASTTAAALNVPSRKLSSSTPHKQQQQQRSSPFIAPELIEGQPYDGYTVDLWSVGVLLYVMLMGSLPFYVPNTITDVQYRQINRGQLKQMIQQLRQPSSRTAWNYFSSTQDQRPISDEVIDLLQNMLWHDPRKRLTLHEVMMHSWILSNHHTSSLPPQTEGVKT